MPVGTTYERWDALRRALWPRAIHTQWDSYDALNLLASWSPHTKRCHVSNPKKSA